jgi:hypothetical protein
MISIPLYFQVTSDASSTVAGAHLLPAVVGNAIGGIVSGLIIKRYVFFTALPSCWAVLMALCLAPDDTRTLVFSLSVQPQLAIFCLLFAGTAIPIG